MEAPPGDPPKGGKVLRRAPAENFLVNIGLMKGGAETKKTPVRVFS